MAAINLTSKPHFIPCFWSALWNKQYYSDFKSNSINQEKCREVRLFLLSKNRKDSNPKAKRVFVWKKLGLIRITPHELRMMKTRGQGIFKSIGDNGVVDDETDRFDVSFEDIYSGIEKEVGYCNVLNIVKQGTVNSEDRIYISTFLVYHSLRSPYCISQLKLKYGHSENPEFEAYKEWYQWIIGGKQERIAQLASLHYSSYWTLYNRETADVPLSDNPILQSGKKIYAILSPEYVLEIDCCKPQKPSAVQYSVLDVSKYLELKTEIIKQCSYDLVFNDFAVLNEWKSSAAWKEKI